MQQESGGLRRLGGSVVDMAAVVQLQEQNNNWSLSIRTNVQGSMSLPATAVVVSLQEEEVLKSMFFSGLDGGT